MGFINIFVFIWINRVYLLWYKGKVSCIIAFDTTHKCTLKSFTYFIVMTRNVVLFKESTLYLNPPLYAKWQLKEIAHDTMY